MRRSLLRVLGGGGEVSARVGGVERNGVTYVSLRKRKIMLSGHCSSA